ncbi:MAG: hypothetical protein JO112_23735, partial [Planctomycetes bacterium]|nr:hypothetical protein [Planctomycetota bacterium]
MTEAEWLACDNPDRMLQHLGTRVSARKLRLFACACGRRLWDVLPDNATRRAVEVLENCADGLGTFQDLQMAVASAETAERRTQGRERAAARAVGAAWSTVEHACSAAAQASPAPAAERVYQAYLLREVVGNPFRLVPIEMTWLSWNAGCVEKLARAIHDQGRFVDLPILADALEE